MPLQFGHYGGVAAVDVAAEADAAVGVDIHAPVGQQYGHCARQVHALGAAGGDGGFDLFAAPVYRVVEQAFGEFQRVLYPDAA